MATYVVLSIIVLAAIAVMTLSRRNRVFTRATLISSVLLLMLTAVFDNLIIMSDIVAYDTARILGVYVGRAPIEDFAYTIGAVMLVPLLWSWFGKEA